MNYAELDLAVDREAARERITDRVSGISVRTTGERDEFLTPSGFHLAELAGVTLPNGERGSRLTYRTAIVSPVAAHARLKAQQIRDAIEPHRYREGRHRRR